MAWKGWCAISVCLDEALGKLESWSGLLKERPRGWWVSLSLPSLFSSESWILTGDHWRRDRGGKRSLPLPPPPCHKLKCQVPPWHGYNMFSPPHVIPGLPSITNVSSIPDQLLPMPKKLQKQKAKKKKRHLHLSDFHWFHPTYLPPSPLVSLTDPLRQSSNGISCHDCPGF